MKRVLIEQLPIGTSVCVVNNNELEEYYFEKTNKNLKVGNIYKGKVFNTLRGMEAAFVNIGLEKNAYLSVDDTLVDANLLSNRTFEQSQSISDLKEGQQILCQVVKDEISTKGARISMNLSIPGRVLVLTPYNSNIGISKKIEDQIKKEELLQLVEKNCAGYGFIIRTQAAQAELEEIKFEIEHLKNEFKRIQDLFLKSKPGTLLYEESNLINRVMRDIVTSDIDEVVVNSNDIANEILKYKYVRAVRENKVIIRDEFKLLSIIYDIQDQIDGILSNKVVLQNGAFLMIDKTEALTVIDVNTGKYIGNKELEETVFQTNKLAAKEIARQLKLRNIGGIIIVDFIDMYKEENKKTIIQCLENEFKKDRVYTNVEGMTNLGLVEITRKKTRDMLETHFSQLCPCCKGKAEIFSDDYIMQKIKNDLLVFLENRLNAKIFVKVAPQILKKIFAINFFARECREIWNEHCIYIIPDDNLNVYEYTIEESKEKVMNLPNDAKFLY